MNYIKTITQKGQLLIPKEIREYLGIELNDQVQIVIENGQVILKKPTKDLKEFAGIIRVDHRNLTEDDNEMFEVDNDFFAMSKPSANINSESEVNNFDQSNIYIDDYINTDEVSSETKTITNLNTEKISKEEAVSIVTEENTKIDESDRIKVVEDHPVQDENKPKQKESKFEVVEKKEEERIVLSKNSKQVDLTNSNSTDVSL